MNTHFANGWKTVTRGVALLAILVASQAIAGSPDSGAGGANIAKGNPLGQERTRSVQGLGSNDAFERRSFRTLSADQPRPSSTGRVYLEDYQRVHQTVGKKYPTEARVLGQDRRRSRN